jgi:hypothetical protein
MAIIRVMTAAVAAVGTAIGLAGPAWADEQLNGDYAYTNGATTNTWSITTQCSAEGLCAGTVSGSTGLLVQIKKPVGGPWTVVRHDVTNGWTCPDGSSAPGDLTYAFDPATLTGFLTATSKPGACNDPNVGQNQLPISLVRI